jgi:hypothetical protein
MGPQLYVAKLFVRVKVDIEEDIMLTAVFRKSDGEHCRK